MEWLEQLISKRQEGRNHAFFISGQVQDYVLADSEDGGSIAVSLEEYLSALFGNCIVATYDLERGIDFPNGSRDKMAFLKRLGLLPDEVSQSGSAMAALMGAGGSSAAQADEIPLPRAPGEALDLLSQFVRAPRTNGDDRKPVVILSYVETLIPAKDKSMLSPAEVRELVRFQNLGKDFRSFKKSGGILIGLTRNLEDINSEVRGGAAQWGAVEIALPDVEERERFLEYLSARKPHINLEAGLSLREIAERSPILTRIHLEDIYLQADLLEDPLITREMVLSRIRELIKAEYVGVVELLETRYGFEALDGLEEFKEFTTRNIILPVRDGNLDRLPKGILAMGPPGVGKTYSVTAVAKEAGLPVFGLSPSNLLGGIVGESQKNTRKALDAIKAAAPCICFIDEAEEMAPKRDSSGMGAVSSDSIRRSIQTMLMTFTGDPSIRGKVVFFYATNYPEQMDDAFIRSGRVDAKFPFFLPEAEPRKRQLERGVGKMHDIAERDFAAVAEELEGYTQAELEAVTREAVNLAQDRARDEGLSWREAIVKADDLREAAGLVRRTTRGIPGMTRSALANTDRTSFLPPRYRRMAEERQEELRDEIEAPRFKPVDRGGEKWSL